MAKVDGESPEAKEIELQEEGLGYDYVFKRLPEIRWLSNSNSEIIND